MSYIVERKKKGTWLRIIKNIQSKIEGFQVLVPDVHLV